ncbi:MAG: 50S ribosomal protein L22 [Bdellovibrionales bacterium]|nr:50S ribosomal protein L22 [Bdellovibrionales bacterium]NQZ17684.1 50S ribosomal protein L22 [Bdellovibrionales bacterium]
MEVKASLKFVRVGDQKARAVADMIRGKMVNDAIRILTYENKKPAQMIKKLVESAVANADQKQVIDVDNLYIKEIMVDKGPFIKRYQPRAQGRAFVIKKKSSHINVVLDER